MLRKRKHETESVKSPAALYRAPIVSPNLIIRESNRADAADLEATMTAAGLDKGRRTVDGARRFGPGLADVPVWSATRAVAEKGATRIVGGLVLTEHEEGYRIGWWLTEGAQHHGVELITAADQRLREMGVGRVVIHVRADDESAAAIATQAGFRSANRVQHETADGVVIDFDEFVKA